MGEITATLVKELREKTGAGMMECKKALTEANGDLAEAEVVLRKRGIASASKKASRTTMQGLVGAHIAPGGQMGVLAEVNCESDFVARTDDFQSLVKQIVEQVAEKAPSGVHKAEGGAGGVALYDQPLLNDPSTTVEQFIATKIAKIGENISVARFSRFEVASSKPGLIGTYIHPGSQLGVLVEMNTETEAAAKSEDLQALVKDVAMQIAAHDPQFIHKSEVTEELLQKERDIYRARAANEGKPEKMLDKIVEGRMSKYYEEVCLLEQPFIKDNALTVQQLIGKTGKGITVARFSRFKVGDTAQSEEPGESQGASS